MIVYSTEIVMKKDDVVLFKTKSKEPRGIREQLRKNKDFIDDKSLEFFYEKAPEFIKVTKKHTDMMLYSSIKDGETYTMYIEKIIDKKNSIAECYHL
jgi:hypothetical protein